MDNLCQYFQTPAESADLREKLAIPAGARVVLLACNPVNTMGMVNSLSTEKYHDSIVQAAHAAGTNGWQVLVKPHLLEMENFRKKGLRAKLEAMPHVRFPDGMHLNACLAASDSVLIFNSTVALESALAGKPCGILMLHPWEHGCDFVENGLACEIRNPDELAAFLDSGSPAQPENIKRYLALTSGSAEMILQDTGDFLKTKTDPNFSSGEQ
jgi:hypothetical protein